MTDLNISNIYNNLDKTKTMLKPDGFTLIEMLIVIMLIAILATLAIPNDAPRQARLQVAEALKYSDEIKPGIKLYYGLSGRFPVNNAEAGQPDSSKLINTLIEDTSIEDGVIHITFGNNAHSLLKGKILSIQPLIVSGSPTSPIDWTCGFSKIPDGMIAVGHNKTNIEQINLPVKCMPAASHEK